MSNSSRDSNRDFESESDAARIETALNLIWQARLTANALRNMAKYPDHSRAVIIYPLSLHAADLEAAARAFETANGYQKRQHPTQIVQQVESEIDEATRRT